MEYFEMFKDLVLHLDKHLEQLVSAYGTWAYLILFLVIFCETGLVVTPFLPGDSLLFAAGAVAALGSFKIVTLICLLVGAAVLGDTCNYFIGRYVGPKIFHKKDVKLLNREHLDKTQKFYEKHGGKTLILARFLPILRTFAPFVAGIGNMEFSRFIRFSIVGGILWVGSFASLGYWFGQQKLVKENFSLVILAIVVISVMPALIEFIKARRAIAVKVALPSQD